MDREFIIEFANKYYITNQVLIKDINYLLTSYCEEFKKDPYKTRVLINLVQQLGSINSYIVTALDYYMKKFNINLLLNKQKTVIKIL